MKKKNDFQFFLFFIGALITPYLYYITVRPKLVEWEKKLENSITNVSDEELQIMKSKLKQNSKNKNEEIKTSNENKI